MKPSVWVKSLPKSWMTNVPELKESDVLWHQAQGVKIPITEQSFGLELVPSKVTASAMKPGLACLAVRPLSLPDS